MSKILIVDDSIFTRSIHQQIISSVGYETITAESGTQAVEIYSVERPDLVMMDLLMPDMDGMDALQEIKAKDPEAKVLICSTDKQKYRKEDAKRFGAAGFIAKPVDPDELKDLLAAILDRTNCDAGQ